QASAGARIVIRENYYLHFRSARTSQACKVILLARFDSILAGEAEAHDARNVVNVCAINNGEVGSALTGYQRQFRRFREIAASDKRPQFLEKLDGVVWVFCNGTKSCGRGVIIGGALGVGHRAENDVVGYLRARIAQRKGAHRSCNRNNKLLKF